MSFLPGPVRRRLLACGLPVALAATVSFPARAQEDPDAPPAKPELFRREYSLAPLTTPVPDHPPISLGLFPPCSKPGVPSGCPLPDDFGLPPSPLASLGGESVLALVRSVLEDEMRAEDGRRLGLEGERLVAVVTPAAHLRIVRLLDELRRLVEPAVVVEGTVAWVEDALLDAWRADAPGAALSEASARALEQALAKGERASAVRTLRGTARNAQRVTLESVTEHAYVEDCDMEITTGAIESDPIMGTLRLGASLCIRPVLAGGRFTCEVRFTHQDGTLPIPALEPPLPDAGALQLPAVLNGGVETSVAGRDGQTVLAARAVCAGAGAPAGPAPRSLCFFLCVRRALPSPTPAKDPATRSAIRCYDLRPLTHSGSDAWVPFVGIVSEAHDKVLVTGSPVPAAVSRDFIRERFSPSTWDELGACLADASIPILVARNAPGILDDVAKHLEALETRSLRTVTTRLLLLAADPAAYAALRAKVPALGTKEPRLDPASVAEILARAQAADGLSVAASAEVTGLDRQLACVHLLRPQAYVRDYDVELATNCASLDPQVDVVQDGLVLACRPSLDDDGRSVTADLQAVWGRLDRPIRAVSVKAGRYVHQPSLSRQSFRAILAVQAGDWTLVGVRGPVKTEAGERHLLALARWDP